MIYRLPPLNALRVFEAAARHLSFKEAANELALEICGSSPLAVRVAKRSIDAAIGVTLDEGIEIENGELGLEESLVKYERGNFLILHCRGVLTSAEKQIEQLTRGKDGRLVAAPTE